MPLPPSAQCVQRIALVPTLSAAFITSAISASVSVMKSVDGHHGRHAELLHVLDVAREVDATLGDGRDVLVLELILRDAAVHLERAHGRHDHGRRRLQARLAALDVEELLGPEVGAEAGLGDDVVGKLQRGRGRQHRVAAVRDVGERTAVDEDGIVLQRLHQVRHQRVLEQDGHRAIALEVARGHRLALAGIARRRCCRSGARGPSGRWRGRRSPSPRRRP